ncbi:MAG: helix-turn-helix transcriptional regulator [Brevundimonas sp.]|uniref:helix-turn-helix domain-containing protein n=1 Tax=Brevundimonas sp. TaxID=1871086 RepID=UPI0027256B1A|nr:helix-turn-helix transcriptional regulator [Brevundimonas sp.]MDO9608114.1 helix-turn-helix transcriptional regulator [Brevundimonas sp.]
MIDTEAERISHCVREELARRRLSRQALADMARISISTLEKALSGRRAFTLATVIRLEQALGVALRPSQPTSHSFEAPVASPDAMGSYSRGAVRWLEGRYLTLRPSFGYPNHIYAYLTDIVWNVGEAHLVFSESERLDSAFSQRGNVSVPHLSGHTYLVTNVDGQYRMAVLGRPTIRGALYGILTTLMVGHGSQLVPAAVPIALVPSPPAAEWAFGLIAPENPAYARYRAELDNVTTDDFARFPR